MTNYLYTHGIVAGDILLYTYHAMQIFCGKMF